MTPDDYKQLIRRVFEGVSRGDWAVIHEAFAPHNWDYSLSEPLPPDRITQSLQDLRSQVPDLRAEVLRLVAEGDTVMTIEQWSGTSAATGERVDGTVFHLFRFDDDQVVEEWSAGWSWLDRLRASETPRSMEHSSSPLFTTRVWTFKPGCTAQGQSTLQALDRAAEQIPGAQVRLFQDRQHPERFVTVGQWPTDASFDVFDAHPDTRQAAAVLGPLLDETFPADDAIFMDEIGGKEEPR